jgi:hypothetical protein
MKNKLIIMVNFIYFFYFLENSNKDLKYLFIGKISLNLYLYIKNKNTEVKNRSFEKFFEKLSKNEESHSKNKNYLKK